MKLICRSLLSSLVILFAVMPSIQAQEADGSGALWEARTALKQHETAAKAASEFRVGGKEEEAADQAKRAQESLEKARRLFDDGGALTCGDPEILMDYASALRMLGDLDLAGEAYEAVLRLAPDQSAAWLGMANAYGFLQGPAYIAKAEKAFTRALEFAVTPEETILAHIGMANFLVSRKLPALARKHYEAVLAQDATNIPAIIGKASLDAREGKVAEAAQAIDSLGPMTPPQYAEMANALMADALNDFSRAKLWFADDAANHIAYAKLLLRADMLPQSILPLERAAVLEPGNYITWNFLASIKQSLGDTAGAKLAYTKSLELKQDQPRTKQALDALNQTTATTPSAAPASEPAPVPVPVPVPVPAVEPTPTASVVEPAPVPAPPVE